MALMRDYKAFIAAQISDEAKTPRARFDATRSKFAELLLAFVAVVVTGPPLFRLVLVLVLVLMLVLMLVPFSPFVPMPHAVVVHYGT